MVPSSRPEYGVLIASAILSMAIGYYSPDNAMYAYFLNLASPLVRRWTASLTSSNFALPRPISGPAFRQPKPVLTVATVLV